MKLGPAEEGGGGGKRRRGRRRPQPNSADVEHVDARSLAVDVTERLGVGPDEEEHGGSVVPCVAMGVVFHVMSHVFLSLSPL